MLSQSKISDKQHEKWTINIKQHYLLTFFPPFSSGDLSNSSKPNRYRLRDPCNRFSNYSLASRHGQPKYCSTTDIGTWLHNWDYTQQTSVCHPNAENSALESTVGFTSSLVNGYTGVNLLNNSELERFIDDLVDYASNNKSINPRPDGGQQMGEEGARTFAVIRIIVDREE